MFGEPLDKAASSEVSRVRVYIDEIDNGFIVDYSRGEVSARKFFRTVNGVVRELQALWSDREIKTEVR